MSELLDLPERIEGALVGVCIGEAAAGAPAGAADLLGVAESLAATGGYDPDDLRRRGLERPSKSGPPGLLLRGLPFGLLSPLDRPRLRRDAYRCVALAGGDGAIAISAVAVAILAADLARFDLDTSLVRLRQSLLEDAPAALLDRFRLAGTVDEAPDSQDPGSVVQRAVVALASAEGIDDVVAASAGATDVSRGLAGALAGVREGLRGLSEERIHAVAHADSAIAIARRLADSAQPLSLPSASGA